jgi:hypothetical protein
MHYAHIAGGRVAEVYAALPDFHPDFVAALIPCGDEVQPGWSYANGEFSTASPIDYRSAAQTALYKSDVTVLRCYSAGIAVPAEWNDWRAHLREVLRTGTGPMQQQPAYPAGT